MTTTNTTAPLVIAKVLAKLMDKEYYFMPENNCWLHNWRKAVNLTTEEIDDPWQKIYDTHITSDIISYLDSLNLPYTSNYVEEVLFFLKAYLTPCYK